MTAKELEKLIHRQIPLSKRMGLRVRRATVRGGVTFTLPLKPNKNHKNTAFGGTLVAAQALACWAWIMILLKKKKIQAEVVVQRQNSEFLYPVKGPFHVQALAVVQSDMESFLGTLSRHSKARLNVSARVIYGGKIAANYTGQYVAIRDRGQAVSTRRPQ